MPGCEDPTGSHGTNRQALDRRWYQSSGVRLCGQRQGARIPQDPMGSHSCPPWDPLIEGPGSHEDPIEDPVQFMGSAWDPRTLVHA
jgi:hypothetical protein